MTQIARMPIQPGEAAPEFAVPSVQDDRTICLADYRGRASLLLGLFPGLYCPFCRRAIAQMAATSEVAELPRDELELVVLGQRAFIAHQQRMIELLEQRLIEVVMPEIRARLLSGLPIEVKS